MQGRRESSAKKEEEESGFLSLPFAEVIIWYSGFLGSWDAEEISSPVKYLLMP